MKEDFYKEIFDTSFDSIVIFSSEGIINFNSSACKLFRCSDKQEVLGLSPFAFIPGRAITEIQERWPDVIALIEKQGIYLFEGVLRRFDGEDFYAEVHISKLNIKEKNWFQAIIRETHDWRLAENKLKESEEKFRKAFNLNPDSININRLSDGMYISINKGFTQLTGYTEEDVIGKTSLELNIWENPEDRMELIAGLKKQGIVNNLEATFRLKNGETKTGWMSAAIIELKEVPHILSITKDVTEIKKFEAELLKSKELAEKSDKLKDAFIANISHEIRTPLHGILGMTSLIEESLGKYSSEEENQLFDSIRRSSKRIMNTIDMILNYSRLQVNDFIISLETVNVNNIIEHLIAEFRNLTEAKNLQVIFENQVGDVMLKTDEYCLAQSLLNLIDNAIKYTSKGYIKIILRLTDGNVCIEIEDTGIGISEEYQASLFHPYTQEEIGYSRSYEGIGLGLSLTKKYLELINGTITVETKKGVGSKFTIFIQRH